MTSYHLRSVMLLALVALSAAPAIAAETAAAAASPNARALVRDLGRIVALQERTGWGIDDYEFESMLPSALETMCRTPESAWGETERILADALAAAGGDPAEALKNPDVTLSDVAEMMSAWRTTELLRLALAEKTRCPFWMKQRESFRGLHSDQGRLSLHGEGGGAIIGRFIDGKLRFGAGGGGRVTLGYGFSESWDVRGGLGFGGGALADETVQAENLEADFYIDVPVILRHSGMLWRQEIELAGIAHGIPWKDPMQFGVRFGGLIGLGYLRVQEFMPWAGLGIYAEYSFARNGMPDVWTLRAGVRVGISWSSTGD